jgi:8-oxo-dGTP pyrophosphatase MutT (NUDIX family)
VRDNHSIVARAMATRNGMDEDLATLLHGTRRAVTPDIVKSVITGLYQRNNWLDLEYFLPLLIEICPELDISPLRAWLDARTQPMERAKKVALMKASHIFIAQLHRTVYDGLLRPWAVVLLAPIRDIPELFAGVTRPVERLRKLDMQPPRTTRLYSLPGGKLEFEELPRDAMLRELAEEGWGVKGLSQKPFYVVDTAPELNELGSIWAYKADCAWPLDWYPDDQRIAPVALTSADIEIRSEVGYDRIMAAYK